MIEICRRTVVEVYANELNMRKREKKRKEESYK